MKVLEDEGGGSAKVDFAYHESGLTLVLAFQDTPNGQRFLFRSRLRAGEALVLSWQASGRGDGFILPQRSFGAILETDCSGGEVQGWLDQHRLLLPDKEMIPEGPQLTVYSATQTCKWREQNEDWIGSYDQLGLAAAVIEKKGKAFVLCDGLGGHPAGEVASSLGGRVFLESYYASEEQRMALRLREAVKEANRAVLQRSQKEVSCRGMRTTLVGAVVIGSEVWFASVGDSDGFLNFEKVSCSHAFTRVMFKVLGSTESVEPDIFVRPFRPGDIFLLFSDGLTASLEEILRRAQDPGTDDPAEALVEEGQGNDDASIIIGKAE